MVFLNYNFDYGSQVGDTTSDRWSSSPGPMTTSHSKCANYFYPLFCKMVHTVKLKGENTKFLAIFITLLVMRSCSRIFSSSKALYLSIIYL
jgi:hypothetical protein